MSVDLGELSHDTNLVNRMQQFSDAAFRIQDMVEVVNNPALYDKLSRPDKIKYNLLLSFSLNSLFWMYLRAEGKYIKTKKFQNLLRKFKLLIFTVELFLSTIGIDPSKHPIKSQNERLKKAMMRAKQIEDRNALMPHINKEAAKRFVRSGLWEPKQKRFKKDNEKQTGES